MDTLLCNELEAALAKNQFNFLWHEETRTWQLERSGKDSTWRSVMYLAPDRETAERMAVKHIQSYYLL